MSFIQSVLRATKEYEPPQRFYYWASLAAISAVLKDNVHFNMGKNYKLYPNIYVLLYGPSGVQKGPPINLAKKLVQLVDNTRIIAGRASIEAIIKELGTVYTRAGKPPINDSCGFIAASELSSSIISNTSSLDILTDLFDRQYNEGNWKYLLKVSDSVTLKSPTITWLAGSNEALFKEYVPEKNLKGGLIGRTFVISENKKNTLNSLMFAPEEYPDFEKLAEMITPLAKLSGEFTMAHDVRVGIDTWYKKFWTDIAPQLEDDTGTVNRILDSIIRVSMLLSCSNRGDMIITVEDVDEAMREVLKLIVANRKTSQTIKQNEISFTEKRILVLKYLANKEGHAEDRISLLQRFSTKLDHEDLDRIIQFFEQLRIIESTAPGGVMKYRLKSEDPRVSEYLEGLKR